MGVDDSGKYPTRSIGNIPLWLRAKQSDISYMSEDLADRVKARLEALDLGPIEAANRMGEGTDRTFVRDIITRKKRTITIDKLPGLARALECRPSDLAPDLAEPPMGAAPPIRVLGTIGQGQDGAVELGAETWISPLPGTSSTAVAIEVASTLRDFAEQGSILFFDQKSDRPVDELIDAVCLVKPVGRGEMVMRLLPGTEPDRYFLAPLTGPMIKNAALEWASEMVGYLTPRQAKRVVVRKTASAA